MTLIKKKNAGGWRTVCGARAPTCVGVWGGGGRAVSVGGGDGGGAGPRENDGGGVRAVCPLLFLRNCRRIKPSKDSRPILSQKI